MSKSLGTSCLPVELPVFPTGTKDLDKNTQTTCVSVVSGLAVPNATKARVSIKRLAVTDFVVHSAWWFCKCCCAGLRDTFYTSHSFRSYFTATVPMSSDKASCYPSPVCPRSYGNTYYHLGLAVVTLVTVTATFVWDLLPFLILAW